MADANQVEDSNRLNQSTKNKVGTDTLKTILQLVRYDIPVLVVGKSSIGKSYTIIEITEKWRLPSSILYIGSEKPENIEGLAKLISGDYETVKDKEGKTIQTGEDILKFLKPYWFPNSNTISSQVANGQSIFDNYIKVYDKKGQGTGKDFIYSYSNLHQILVAMMSVNYPKNENSISVKLTDSAGKNNLSNAITNVVLNSKEFEFKRSKETEIQSTTAYEFTLDSFNAGRDDIRDMCMYLCTLLGYGNYWLILDELDKVDENNKDKYAPLLHIVRERTLKSWTMKEVNDKKGMPIPLDVNYESYGTMADLIRTQISKGLPLLDCRIIGIANATKEIEEALFRRFCQIIMTTTMSLTPPDNEVSTIMSCVNKFAPNEINLDKLYRKIAFLNEVNLQWQYSFIPKMINKRDTDGNFLFQNFNSYFNSLLKARNGNFKEAESMLYKSYDVFTETAFGKIWQDNFMGGRTTNDENVQQLYKKLVELFLCLTEQFYKNSENSDMSALAGATKVGGGTLSPLMRLRNEIIVSYSQYGKDVLSTFETQLQKTYEKTIGNPSALSNWTTNALSYIEASNVNNAGDYDQIAGVGEKMIPFIYQQLMLNYKADKSLDTDSFNSQLIIIEEFFNSFLNKQKEDGTHTLKVDEEQTQKLMFGETKKKLKGMKPKIRVDVGSNSLYGGDAFNSNVGLGEDINYNSLSYSIYQRFYLQGVLTMFIDSILTNNEYYIDFLQSNSNIGIKNFLASSKVTGIMLGYYNSFSEEGRKSAKGERLKELIEKLPTTVTDIDLLELKQKGII